jgi:lysophospholipase L1-like esterase
MRTKLALAAVLLIAAGLLPTVAQARPARYYVSLGDSLSVGIQPNRAGRSLTTRQGYVDYLYRTERRRFRGLRLVKLGCGGEDTTTIRTNSAACSYGRYRNQLEAAEAFLRRHRRQIAFVTIDIGANEVTGCLPGGAVDFTCIAKGLASAKRNVPKIAKRLRRVGGRRMQILGMTYYDPFLQFYVRGGSLNRSLATGSLSLAKQFNADLSSAYRRRRIKVADVWRAFETDNRTGRTTLAPYGSIPTNVARICQLTWMCAPAPVGPNIHANRKGYKLIAKTFARRIRR